MQRSAVPSLARAAASAGRAGLLLAACAAFLAPPARADSWLAPTSRREAAPNGRWYVTLEPTPGRTSVEEPTWRLVRADPAATPVASVGGAPGDAAATPLVRAGDAVVATGILPHWPVVVRVHSEGEGFAAIDEWGGIGLGETFVWVPREGARVVRRLADLFTPAELATFHRSASSTWWRKDAWLDEAAGLAVLVAHGGVVKTVDLATGVVTTGGVADVRRALAAASPHARRSAVRVATEVDAQGLAADLAAAAGDERADVIVRWLAARATAKTAPVTFGPLVRAALLATDAAAPSREDLAGLLDDAPAALGDDLLPTLVRALRAHAADAAARRPIVGALRKAAGEAGASIADDPDAWERFLRERPAKPTRPAK